MNHGLASNIELEKMPIPNQNKFILCIAEAIAHHEGFYKPGSRAYRNNNPGNLRGWSASNPKDSGGFDEFETRRAGFQALYRQIEINIVNRELTVHEFFAGKPGVYAGYAPESDNNDTNRYAEVVIRFLEDRGFYPLSRLSGFKAWYAGETANAWDTLPKSPNSVTEQELQDVIDTMDKVYNKIEVLHTKVKYDWKG